MYVCPALRLAATTPPAASASAAWDSRRHSRPATSARDWAHPRPHLAPGLGPPRPHLAPGLAPAQPHANCPAGHRRIDRHGGRTDCSRLSEQRTGLWGSSFVTKTAAWDAMLLRGMPCCVGCHAGGKHVGSFGSAPRQLHGMVAHSCRMHTLSKQRRQTTSSRSMPWDGIVVHRIPRALIIYDPTRRGIPYGMGTGTAPGACGFALCTTGRRQRRTAISFHSSTHACRAPAAASAR